MRPELADPRFDPLSKVAEALRILRLFVLARLGLRRQPLPAYLEVVKERSYRATRYRAPRRLGRIVGRVLSVGPLDPRCIFRAVVLFELLRAQGDRPELVIGLPADARDHKAHAWVEVAGIDVGPPPGRSGHQPLARYG